MSDLILFDKKVATRIEIEKLFSEKDGLKPILKMIEEVAKDFEADLNTKEGRDKYASQAYAVARSKTFLDGVGKELTAEWREKTSRVNDGRNEVKKFLDNLKDEIRKPLTEIEEKEKAEAELKKKLIENLEMVLLKYHSMSEMDSLVESHRKVSEVKIEGLGEEFEYKAFTARNKAIEHLNDCIQKREAYDKDQEERRKEREELARLREEEEKRKAQEAEQKRIEEAREKARIEAEQKAQREAQEAKDREEKLKAEKEESERRAQEAERKLKEEQEKKEREAEEQKKREEDFKSRETQLKKNAHNAMLDTLKENGISEEVGKKVVTLIAKGKIPHIVVNYSIFAGSTTRSSTGVKKEERKEPSFKLN